MSRTSDFIEVHRGQLDYLVQLTQEIKKLQTEAKKTKAELIEQFLNERITSISTTEARFTLSKTTTTSSFDAAAFKEDHPALYEEYLVVKPRSQSLSVTLK